MKTLRHLLFAAIPFGFLVGLASADTSRKASVPANVLEDSAIRQAQLKRAFEAFRNKLAHLARRLETGCDADKLRAKSLRNVLKLIGDQNTEGRFDSLIRSLTSEDAGDNLDTLRSIMADNQDLRKDLQSILKLLLEGDPTKTREKKIENLTKLLDRLKEAREKQARLHAQTERGIRDNKDLAPQQDKLAEQTKDILKPTTEESAVNEKARESIRKPVEAATREQQKAARALAGDNGKDAGEAQGRALDNLDVAIRILEDQLLQERQEERQDRLLDLTARCKRMLAMQLEVRDANATLDRDIQKANKSTVAHGLRANKLADRESTLLFEVESALELVRAEGTAVAFVEVFEGLSSDVETVRDRLARTDTGRVTQSTISDVIDTLEEMIRALEKSQREPMISTPRPPRSGPRPAKPLVDLLQQLKMVMGMQKRIHDRTALYGKRIPGEQLPELPATATAPEKRNHEATGRELRSLADRQDRLGKVTREVGKQAEAEGGTRID